jgi:hypothetical protein
MTPPPIPDLPDFGPDDDPDHNSQSGWWLGPLLIASTLISIFALWKVADLIVRLIGGS